MSNGLPSQNPTEPNRERSPTQPLLAAEVVADLVREHGDELRRFLMGVLRDFNLANEAWQNTVVRLMEAGHEAREASRKAWLFRVGFNEAMLLRRRQTIDRRAMERLVWNRPAGMPGADLSVIEAEEAEAVQQAIAELPAGERQVVRLRICEDLKFTEIAEQLEIPLGTALSRMRSALIKLREKLRKLTGDE